MPHREQNTGNSENHQALHGSPAGKGNSIKAARMNIAAFTPHGKCREAGGTPRPCGTTPLYRQDFLASANIFLRYWTA